MRLWGQLAEVLAPYFDRLEQRQGLKPYMIASLKAHPEIPTMVWKTMELFLLTEAGFDFAGSVALKRQRIKKLLEAQEPDYWLMDVLVIPPVKCLVPGPVAHSAIHLETKQRYTFDVFNQAMTIAHHLGLLAGWGRSRVHPELLQAVRVQLGLIDGETTQQAS